MGFVVLLERFVVVCCCLVGLERLGYVFRAALLLTLLHHRIIQPSRYLIKRASPQAAMTSPLSLNGGKGA